MNVNTIRVLSGIKCIDCAICYHTLFICLLLIFILKTQLTIKPACSVPCYSQQSRWFSKRSFGWRLLENLGCSSEFESWIYRCWPHSPKKQQPLRSYNVTERMSEWHEKFYFLRNCWKRKKLSGDFCCWKKRLELFSKF